MSTTTIYKRSIPGTIVASILALEFIIGLESPQVMSVCADPSLETDFICAWKVEKNIGNTLSTGSQWFF